MKKTCLDVGCRSGENTAAMAREGAEVIGIDPDDTEFEKAKSLGIKETHLVKATLQCYYAQNPLQKFDIVTVFLWNISSSETQEFCLALNQVIKPGGTVIITYQDEEYSNIPGILTNFFNKVKTCDFSGINVHAIRCSQPKTDPIFCQNAVGPQMSEGVPSLIY